MAKEKRKYIPHRILPGSENERNTILVQGCVQNRRTGGGGSGAQLQNYRFSCASEQRAALTNQVGNGHGAGKLLLFFFRDFAH